ncbi:MAG TPA: SpvB/TcaC N-terminal domain-containing protein, partial [Alphaproteobacteria bacterium]|nr:SpvB/TcaC N-terminal domain-containing protein [Alphaproteobacteria bacterium]
MASKNYKILALANFAIVIAIIMAFNASAEDYHKPFRHTTVVPEQQELVSYGKYEDDSYYGSSSYNYDIDVPDGVNGFEPKIILEYNSHNTRSQSVLGFGWTLSENYIYRNTNGSVVNTSNDMFFLLLNGERHELTYYEGSYHTIPEYYYKIENYSSYWIVTDRDGTQYRFGFIDNSTIASGAGYNYIAQWHLDS